MREGFRVKPLILEQANPWKLHFSHNFFTFLINRIAVRGLNDGFVKWCLAHNKQDDLYDISGSTNRNDKPRLRLAALDVSHSQRNQVSLKEYCTLPVPVSSILFNPGPRKLPFLKLPPLVVKKTVYIFMSSSWCILIYSILHCWPFTLSWNSLALFSAFFFFFFFNLYTGAFRGPLRPYT